MATVIFENPERFTDFTNSGFGSATEKDLKYLTDVFTAHIERLAHRFLRPEEKLEITFKDIDLADQFEPEHGPSVQHVRIDREVTYPRMHLVFRLLGPDGQVQAEGERKLLDMNYSRTIFTPLGDDEYRYDFALLTDSMKAEFQKKKI